MLFQKCLSDMIMESETAIENPFNSGRDREKKKSTFVQALEPIFISLGDSCSSVDGRSFIIVELIKYLLYTRQQVPRFTKWFIIDLGSSYSQDTIVYVS